MCSHMCWGQRSGVELRGAFEMRGTSYILSALPAVLWWAVTHLLTRCAYLSSVHIAHFLRKDREMHEGFPGRETSSRCYEDSAEAYWILKMSFAHMKHDSKSILTFNESLINVMLIILKGDLEIGRIWSISYSFYKS